MHLPLLDPNMRATPLTPSEWKERLEARTCLDVSSSETSGRRLLLLDVRNGKVLLYRHIVFWLNRSTLFPPALNDKSNQCLLGFQLCLCLLQCKKARTSAKQSPSSFLYSIWLLITV